MSTIDLEQVLIEATADEMEKLITAGMEPSSQMFILATKEVARTHKNNIIRQMAKDSIPELENVFKTYEIRRKK